MSPERLSRRALIGRASAAAAGVATAGLAGAGPAAARRWPAASVYSAAVPAAWFELTLELIRTTPGFTPPVASRAIGYSGVALYEAIAPGTARRRSLAGRLNGLTIAPSPAGGAYHWPTVANSALAAILRRLFATTPAQNAAAIDALERRFRDRAKAGLPWAVYRRSVLRGSVVAGHVAVWAASDGAHEAHARNFPPYTPPAGPGLWVPTPPAFLSAMQPTWGTNRPLALRSGASCAPAPPLAYSEEPSSPFQIDAAECHRVGRALTGEQQAIARFWSDDPGLTATPAGHSLALLNQVVRQRHVRLDRAAEAYAKLGIAVADAFIACWQTKFRYHVVRPVTCVRAVIDPDWSPLLVTPPFPEYTSGHSVQSGAAAEVLTDMFGPVAITDVTHAARGLPARSFENPRAAAQEAAMSRLYAGIHFRSAVERGLQQGRCVGRRVNRLL